MRKSTIVMIGFAVLFGVIAVFVAQSWLKGQAEMRLRSIEAENHSGAAAQTIVVAAKPLRFGTELASTSLREMPWPADALPAGAFGKISEVVGGNLRRVVLSPIEASEPVLASKITGPGQRATLSARLDDGMRAVTVRVNDVEGVAGFVLPGERVDLVLTRLLDKHTATTDVVLQNIRVLAIDQIADERNDKPSIAKAVTLEVDATSAQKVALAASVGTLSLLLRKPGDSIAETPRRITLSDLIQNGSPNPNAKGPVFTTVRVYRPPAREEFSVQMEPAARERP